MSNSQDNIFSGILRGKNHPSWKGGRIIQEGYVLVPAKNHPRANRHGYIWEHILVAEEILGRPLSPNEEVHHRNEIKHDNSPENIRIFPNHGSHKAYHERVKAFNECGHYDWRKCHFCHQYENPENLYIKGNNSYHRNCSSEYMRNRRKLNKGR